MRSSVLGLFWLCAARVVVAEVTQGLDELAPLFFAFDGQLPLPPCLARLKHLQNASKHEVGALQQMFMATGRSTPYDAGRYAICQNVDVGFGVETKFFIVTYALVVGGKAAGAGEIGVCLPAECEDGDFEVLREFAAMGDPNSTITKFAKGLRFPAQSIGEWPAPPGTVAYPNPFNNKDDLKPRSAWTTVAVAVVFAFVAFVLYSTFVVRRAMRRVRSTSFDSDLLAEGEGQQPRRQEVRLPAKLAPFQAFALVGPTGTWTSLWNVDISRPTDCLNGMKVVSMFFIILGHGLLEPLGIVGYRNAECIVKTPFCLDAANTQPFTYLLLAGQLGVDTFFFIAGFLLSFVGKSRSVPVIMGTALRYMRLLPLFGFVMMMYILVAPYLVFGPFAPRMQSTVFTACNNDTWWSELLFINAFYPWFTADGGCMGWSWYLGVDMVFAILGLLLLNLWKKFPKIAWATTLAAMVASIAVTIQQSLEHELKYNVVDPSFAVYGHYLYSRPYARLPGFLLGLMTPWVMDIMEKRGIQRGTQPRSILARCVVFVFCILALVLVLGCIFLPVLNSSGPGPYNTARPALQWTKWQNALWIALNRPVWVMGWLIWTLACYYDYMPATNWVLSHPVFAPLASLTYGAYLVHPIIIKVIAGNSTDYYHYSFLGAFEWAFFNAILAYTASVILWCLIEKPMATLTSFLVPKRRPVAKPPTVNPEAASGSA